MLLQIDPTTTTLYLENQQITLTSGSGSLSTTRYYSLPGGATVVRTGTGTNYSFEIADQQGTGVLYLDYTAQTPTWRQFDPYGVARGTAVTWIDNRTVMNKATDTVTGLTSDGARYLDSGIGRFISLDPVFEAGDTLALNGYGYTSDNPVTYDDPSGQMMRGPGGIITSCDRAEANYAAAQKQQQEPYQQYQSDASAAESGDLEHGCRGGGMCVLHVTHNYETNSNFVAQRVKEYEAEKQAEAQAQAEQATKKASSCSGFWGCAWHDATRVVGATAQAMADTAPMFDLIALLTAGIPGIDGIVREHLRPRLRSTG